MEYMLYGITILSNMQYYYSTVTLEGKQQMLGSIFPEKLIFSENNYRTAEPSEIIALLCSVNKEFGGSKKRKAIENSGQSTQVTPARVERATFGSGNRHSIQLSYGVIIPVKVGEINLPHCNCEINISMWI